jgi:rhodanese-related sulfurtransferase
MIVPSKSPRRRTVLATCGALLGGLISGCLGAEDGADGHAPEDVVPANPPPSPAADPDTFDTIAVDGTPVPLVPIDVAHAWYLRREARFADARGQGQYERAHVAGAAHSPAPDGGANDPVADWPVGDRVVTYCGCPHHLSTLRASSLIQSGYEHVYAIDEGFVPWFERGYPTRGSAVENDLASYEVRGRTDPADAGELAWAVHEGSDQQEAAPIQPDGSFAMTLHFGGIGADAPITVRTPSFEVTQPLSSLTTSVVTGE